MHFRGISVRLCLQGQDSLVAHNNNQPFPRIFFLARATTPHRIDHMSEGRLATSCHLSGLPTSSLIEERRKWSEKDMAQLRGRQSLGADVLSTQSTRDPEVVNGINESMARLHWRWQRLFVDFRASDISAIYIQNSVLDSLKEEVMRKTGG